MTTETEEEDDETQGKIHRDVWSSNLDGEQTPRKGKREKGDKTPRPKSHRQRERKIDQDLDKINTVTLSLFF